MTNPVNVNNFAALFNYSALVTVTDKITDQFCFITIIIILFFYFFIFYFFINAAFDLVCLWAGSP